MTFKLIAKIDFSSPEGAFVPGDKVEAPTQARRDFLVKGGYAKDAPADGAEADEAAIASAAPGIEPAAAD